MKTVFFDLETGGLLDTDPDIQLAAIAVDDSWNELATFEAKIQFDEGAADPEALKLNHYDPDVWKREAISVWEVCRRFDQFLSPFRCLEMISKRTGAPYSVCKLAAHNAAFDGPRLKRMFASQFLAADPRIRCTLQRALWYFDEHSIKPADFKLETLCKYFQIPVEGAHDALTDVRMAVALAKRLSSAQAEVAA